MKTVYFASKVKHAHMWRMVRPAVNVIATWIDEAEPGQTVDAADLADRCIREAVAADVFILYTEPGEVLKGALIELGARLGAGKEVRLVGENEMWRGVFSEHRLIRRFKSIADAVKDVWCRHEHLNMEGYCHACGTDCRGAH